MRLYCRVTVIKTIHGMPGTSSNTIRKYVRILYELAMAYERQYFTSVPKDQIKLYKDNGYKLAQNPGWEEE